MREFPCRLYLPAPVGCPLDVLCATLDDALANNDIAAVLYTIGNKDQYECASTLMQCTNDHGAAFIVADNIPFAREVGADGVQISGDPGLYKQARSELGKDKIIGLTTAPNRHDSMCVGEIGSNYIFFDTCLPNPHSSENGYSLEDHIGWWSALFEVPCVAQASGIENQDRALIDAGVDFLSFDNNIWHSKEDARQTLNSTSRLIAECGR